ncbi:MAG: bifunctional hydroxymethylpyrimidine kinase/phosphomethylpyrimidine kinase [Bacteroidales bacterium]|nr:bifunctional hydroxymethylpyrimidine kinase/phosphomethylpyrimidine kinase [Bacteroidales bacterium]
MAESKRYDIVLSIAGSDASGGAGIQADIKTASAMGCYAATAITSVVSENTQKVYSVADMTAEMVVSQIHAVLDDIGVSAIKIGMLHSAEVAHAVAEVLKTCGTKNIVLDPVMVATSGDELMLEDTIEVIKSELMPIARICTPNLPEAKRLLGGREIKTIEEMKQAAIDISEMGCSVMLKGGHLDGKIMMDILCNKETRELLELPQDKVETRNTHGTGCTLSTAIASGLAKGKTLTGAVVGAKTYINQAIETGARYEIGRGHGPVAHFYKYWE